MKRFILSIFALAALVFAVPVRAQYYEIANQIPSLISPALTGGFNYKGYVELTGTAGIGGNRANFAGISTSQGFRYASWFFMGVGLGVDIAKGQDAGPDEAAYLRAPYDYTYESSTTKVMIPVFSDFRFNIGGQTSVSAFVDIKAGAAWLIGSSALRMHDTYMTNDAQFFLRPTVGVRIPINSQNSSQAFNIGVTYQLLTSDNNYYWRSSSVTLNNFGVTLGFEW